MANDLASKLEADSIFMDEHSAGANANHLRALSWAAEQSDRVIIIEEMHYPLMVFVIRLRTGWRAFLTTC
jgi:hypothetical protein